MYARHSITLCTWLAAWACSLPRVLPNGRKQAQAPTSTQQASNQCPALLLITQGKIAPSHKHAGVCSSSDLIIPHPLDSSRVVHCKAPARGRAVDGMGLSRVKGKLQDQHLPFMLQAGKRSLGGVGTGDGESREACTCPCFGGKQPPEEQFTADRACHPNLGNIPAEAAIQENSS